MFQSQRGRVTLWAIASVIIGAGLLSWRAVANGFPLVHYDTGTYIGAWFEHFIPIDRPLPYSWFLRHTSLKATLWITMSVQCLLLSWVLFLSFRYLAGITRPYFWHAVSVLILSLTTGLSVNATQLIADAFTSVMVLTLALLLFAELTAALRMCMFILLFFSVSVHLSHYPVYAGIVGAMLLYWLIQKMRKRPFISGRKLLQAVLVIPAAVGFTCCLNYTQESRWAFNTSASHVVMVNRLLISGIMDDYLDKNCATHPISLCTNREHNNNLLWDQQSSLNVVYGWGEHGKGWMKAKVEYDSIIDDIFSQPDYRRQYTYIVLRDWQRQLFAFDVENSAIQDLNSATYTHLSRHLKGDVKSFLSSEIGRQHVVYSFTNMIQRVVVILASVFLILILLLNRRNHTLPTTLNRTVFLVIGALVLNALTVVIVSMVCTRFQSRLIWLIPLLALIYSSWLTTNQKWKVLFRTSRNA